MRLVVSGVLSGLDLGERGERNRALPGGLDGSDSSMGRNLFRGAVSVAKKRGAFL